MDKLSLGDDVCTDCPVWLLFKMLHIGSACSGCNWFA